MGFSVKLHRKKFHLFTKYEKVSRMFAWIGQNSGQKGIGRGHKCGFANVVFLGFVGKNRGRGTARGWG